MLSVNILTGRGTFQVSAAFDAGPGITVLRAPSGAGKTVVLQTIAGIFRPVSGTINIGSVVVAHASPEAETNIHVRTQDRLIGMVFQDGALLPHRSPIANVELGIRNETKRPLSKDERANVALKLLNDVDASHLATASTRFLSGGEQQRISLARAMAGNPQLLLLDEPFSALDHDSRVRLRDTLRRVVNETSLTTVLVSHDPDDIASLADQIIDLESGHHVVRSHRS